MVNVVLTRFETSDQGTFGYIIAEDLSLLTGELPVRDLDHDGVSDNDIGCADPGKYVCSQTYSPHFKRKLYLLQGVPGRFAVRIHTANFMGDKSKGFHCQLNGCIALGEKIGIMEGQKAILLSTPAVRRFTEKLGGKPFTLEIRNGVA